MSNNNYEELIKKNHLSKEEIKEILPQREPFLMIDEVIDINLEEKKITAKRFIDNQEWYFKGHFPENPVLPGVLMIESMAQTASILGNLLYKKNNADEIIVLAGIDDARFFGIVKPDRDIFIEAKIEKIRNTIFKAQCIVNVDGEKVAQATITGFSKKI